MNGRAYSEAYARCSGGIGSDKHGGPGLERSSGSAEAPPPPSRLPPGLTPRALQPWEPCLRAPSASSSRTEPSTTRATPSTRGVPPAPSWRTRAAPRPSASAAPPLPPSQPSSTASWVRAQGAGAGAGLGWGRVGAQRRTTAQDCQEGGCSGAGAAGGCKPRVLSSRGDRGGPAPHVTHGNPAAQQQAAPDALLCHSSTVVCCRTLKVLLAAPTLHARGSLHAHPARTPPSCALLPVLLCRSTAPPLTLPCHHVYASPA